MSLLQAGQSSMGVDTATGVQPAFWAAVTLAALPLRLAQAAAVGAVSAVELQAAVWAAAPLEAVLFKEVQAAAAQRRKGRLNR